MGIIIEVALKTVRTFLSALAACAYLCATLGAAAAQTDDAEKAGTAIRTLSGRIPVPVVKPAPGQNPFQAAFQSIDQAIDGAPELRTRGFLPQTSSNPSQTAPPTPIGDGIVYLVARLTETGVPLDSGIVWRVFNESGNSEQPLTLVQSATGGDAEFKLPAGEYVVHAAYGQAGQSKRIYVGGDVKSETMVLNAGGLRLAAAIAEDLPISPDAVSYEIYRLDDTASGREAIATDVRSGQIYRLNAGTYQVVSRFGDVNALVRAEISVVPGQLTEATIYHRASEVTLKLVNEMGGEALANTAWTIMTPEGEIVFEKIGAFPSVILAEGTYSIIAKHEIGTFSRQFSVEAGLSRDVEVLTIGSQ